MEYKLSVCMIVKNESGNLSKALESLIEIADEIIIVDTGSMDNTKEIASRYTKKIYDFVWCEDFSKARNYSIAQASNSYILVLDGDEYITKYDKNFLIQTAIQEKKVGRFTLENIYTRNDIQYKSSQLLARFFHKEYYHYVGKIHEQLVRKDNRKTEYYTIPIQVTHLGYEGDLEQRRKKTARNLKYLFQALEENPKDPYLLYQVGKSYFMEEKYEQAIIYFTQLFAYDLDPKLEYVQDGIESYGYGLIQLEKYEQALDLQGVYDEFSRNSDFIFLMGLIFMNNGYFEKAVDEFLKAIAIGNGRVEGVDSFQAYYNIGIIYECLGEIEVAKEYYKKCQEYSLAIKRLQALIPIA